MSVKVPLIIPTGSVTSQNITNTLNALRVDDSPSCLLGGRPVACDTTVEIMDRMEDIDYFLLGNTSFSASMFPNSVYAFPSGDAYPFSPASKKSWSARSRPRQERVASRDVHSEDNPAPGVILFSARDYPVYQNWWGIDKRWWGMGDVPRPATVGAVVMDFINFNSLTGQVAVVMTHLSYSYDAESRAPSGEPRGFIGRGMQETCPIRVSYLPNLYFEKEADAIICAGFST